MNHDECFLATCMFEYPTNRSWVRQDDGLRVIGRAGPVGYWVSARPEPVSLRGVKKELVSWIGPFR